MSFINTIILGIVQGIGEFLPISSSAHLIIVRFLFNIKDNFLDTVAFDVSLHFGTLIAVLIVFLKDWLLYLKGAYINVVHKKSTFEGKMFFYLIIACIPGAIIGLLLEGSLEDLFRSNYILIALTLAFMGIIIYIGDKYADRKYKKQSKFEELTLKQTFLIGTSQALAIIPGFSRSGTTIVTARLLGVSKEAAAKFTFLLSTPVIFGATIFKFKELILNFNLQILVGIITAAIVGLITIKFLLEYIKTKSFAIFAYYRLIIAGIVIIKVLIG